MPVVNIGLLIAERYRSSAKNSYRENASCFREIDLRADPQAELYEIFEGSVFVGKNEISVEDQSGPCNSFNMRNVTLLNYTDLRGYINRVGRLQVR